MYVDNKGNIIAELVHLTTISNHYVDDQNDFLCFVKNIVKGYKSEQVNNEK